MSTARRAPRRRPPEGPAGEPKFPKSDILMTPAQRNSPAARHARPCGCGGRLRSRPRRARARRCRPRHGGRDGRRHPDHRRGSRRRGAGIRPAARPDPARAAARDAHPDPDRAPARGQGGGRGGPRQERRWWRRTSPSSATARSAANICARRWSANVTDAAVKKRFDEQVAKFVPEDEVHASHILVKTEDEAKAIIADLDKGGDFAAIAKEKSQRSRLGPVRRRPRLHRQGQDGEAVRGCGVRARGRQVHQDAGPDPVRLARHQAPGEAEAAGPDLRAGGAAIRQQLIEETVEAELAKLKAAAKIEIVPEAPPAPAPAAPARRLRLRTPRLRGAGRQARAMIAR